MFDSIPFLTIAPFAPVKGLHWEEGLAVQSMSHWLGTGTCFSRLWNVKRWITAHIHIVHICTPLRLEVPVAQIPKGVDKVLGLFLGMQTNSSYCKGHDQQCSMGLKSYAEFFCAEDPQPPQFRSHVPTLCNVLLAIPANCPFLYHHAKSYQKSKRFTCYEDQKVSVWCFTALCVCVFQRQNIHLLGTRNLELPHVRVPRKYMRRRYPAMTNPLRLQNLDAKPLRLPPVITYPSYQTTSKAQSMQTICPYHSQP